MQPIFHRLAFGFGVGGNANFRFGVGGKANLVVHVGCKIPTCWYLLHKILALGHCPTPTPDARYFASQWNIGLSLRGSVEGESGLE